MKAIYLITGTALVETKDTCCEASDCAPTCCVENQSCAPGCCEW